jgi:hypothetical protein
VRYNQKLQQLLDQSQAKLECSSQFALEAGSTHLDCFGHRHGSVLNKVGEVFAMRIGVGITSARTQALRRDLVKLIAFLFVGSQLPQFDLPSMAVA